MTCMQLCITHSKCYTNIKLGTVQQKGEFQWLLCFPILTEESFQFFGDFSKDTCLLLFSYSFSSFYWPITFVFQNIQQIYKYVYVYVHLLHQIWRKHQLYIPEKKSQYFVCYFSRSRLWIYNKYCLTLKEIHSLIVSKVSKTFIAWRLQAIYFFFGTWETIKLCIF